MISPPFAILTLLNDVRYPMVKERIVIGRATCDAPVDLDVGRSSFISRRHLELVWKGNALKLTCNSKNGIFVDKKFRPNDSDAHALPTRCVLRFPSTSICIRVEQCRSQPLRKRPAKRLLRSARNSDAPFDELISDDALQFDASPPSKRSMVSLPSSHESLSETEEHSSLSQSLDICSTNRIGTRRKQALVPSSRCPTAHPSGQLVAKLDFPSHNGDGTSSEKSSEHLTQPAVISEQDTNHHLAAASSIVEPVPVSLNGHTPAGTTLSPLHPPTILHVTSVAALDRGDKTHKPPYSYAQLIAQAIACQPDRQVTLSGIYSYISQNYPYYQAQDKGWQNSVRHNLSLNRYFIKVRRTRENHGKGCFWRIDPLVEAKLVTLAFRKRRSRGYPGLVFGPRLTSGPVRIAPADQSRHLVQPSATSGPILHPLRPLASNVVMVACTGRDVTVDSNFVLASASFVQHDSATNPVYVLSSNPSISCCLPSNASSESIPTVTPTSANRGARIIVCYPKSTVAQQY